jgi:hypothetical protein
LFLFNDHLPLMALPSIRTRIFSIRSPQLVRAYSRSFASAAANQSSARAIMPIESSMREKISKEFQPETLNIRNE